MIPSTFKIGEIATVVIAGDYPEYLGTDCTVVGPLERREGLIHGKPFMTRGYECEMCDGKRMYFAPICLRKKKPPGYDGYQADLWDNLRDDSGALIWKPKTVREKA